MSRQSKSARNLARARHFTALRQAGIRSHNALSRRQIDPATRVKYSAKATLTKAVAAARKVVITQKY